MNETIESPPAVDTDADNHNSQSQADDTNPERLIETSPSQSASVLSQQTASFDLNNLHPLFSLNDVLARSRRYKLRNREAPLWGFFDHISEDTYGCVLCQNTTSPSSSRRGKRQLKGQAKYTSSSGTSSLRRHVLHHHPKELSVLTYALAEENERLRKRKRKNSSKLSTLSCFKTHKKYDVDSIEQKSHDHDLVLLIGKASLPLSFVDNPFFRRYIHGRNPRIQVQNRRKLTDKLIPSFVEQCSSQFIKPRLASFESLTITFDLWMSRGTQDIFDLIAHGMNDQFQQQQVHLRMVECNGTNGLALADVLREELDRHEITNKVIACVKDGGSNLNVCTNSLRDVTCDVLGLSSCLQGSCFAHILSGACNFALSCNISEGLSMINFTSVKATLQNCITWTKKSGKGKSEWYKSCRQMNMKERLMATPVKTRFVSTVVMLKMMLDYREVVQHCFSNQSSPELRTRVPSTEIWEIVRFVVSALEPVMNACILSQNNEGWLISDAVNNIGQLYMHYNAMLDQITSDEEVEGEFLLDAAPNSTIDDQLRIYQRKIALALIERLTPIIKPLVALTDVDSAYAHHYLSLALDPIYKELKYPFMALHARNIQGGRDLAKRYDDEVLLPLLSKLKGVSISEDGSTLVENSVGQQSETTNGNEDSIDCFTIDDDSIPKREKRLLLNELMSYRREPFDKQKHERSCWLSANRAKYPTVISLAKHLLAILPTQIDNERIFSLAGRIASPQRSSSSTENIDNLICVARNYPNTALVLQRDKANYESLAEFSDHLISYEDVEKLESD